MGLVVRLSVDFDEQFAADVLPEMNRMGARMVDDAVRLVPVDTGQLRATITHEVDVVAGVPTLRVSAGNEDIDYAGYVELGTRHQAAQPYLRPAVLQEIT